MATFAQDDDGVVVIIGSGYTGLCAAIQTARGGRISGGWGVGFSKITVHSVAGRPGAASWTRV